MMITVIHGQMHHGVTWTMTHTVLQYLMTSDDTLNEFYLPHDAPDFCCGCCNCFLKGAEHCPSAAHIQPIVQAVERADVIIFDSPNYVMEMSGAMKNLFDHFAYRWVTHRPSAAMFTKVAITLCSSAGAPANHTTHSIAKQLKWMCVPKVFEFPFSCYSLGIDALKPEKKRELESKAQKIATAVKKRLRHPRSSLRAKVMFSIFRKMQSAPAAAWNPVDRDWWVQQGWTARVRPWKH